MEQIRRHPPNGSGFYPILTKDAMSPDYTDSHDPYILSTRLTASGQIAWRQLPVTFGPRRQSGPQSATFRHPGENRGQPRGRQPLICLAPTSSASRRPQSASCIPTRGVPENNECPTGDVPYTSAKPRPKSRVRSAVISLPRGPPSSKVRPQSSSFPARRVQPGCAIRQKISQETAGRNSRCDSKLSFTSDASRDNTEEMNNIFQELLVNNTTDDIQEEDTPFSPHPSSPHNAQIITEPQVENTDKNQNIDNTIHQDQPDNSSQPSKVNKQIVLPKANTDIDKSDVSKSKDTTFPPGIRISEIPPPGFTAPTPAPSEVNSHVPVYPNATFSKKSPAVVRQFLNESNQIKNSTQPPSASSNLDPSMNSPFTLVPKHRYFRLYVGNTLFNTRRISNKDKHTSAAVANLAYLRLNQSVQLCHRLGSGRPSSANSHDHHSFNRNARKSASCCYSGLGPVTYSSNFFTPSSLPRRGEIPEDDLDDFTFPIKTTSQRQVDCTMCTNNNHQHSDHLIQSSSPCWT